MAINMGHEDELLTVPQAAYLLGRSRSSTEKLVMTGALLAVEGKRRRLIKSSDLKRYVDKQIEKYERTMEWIAADDKAAYWKNSGYQGSNTMTEEYLTIPQVAFLFQMSRQGIHYLCENDILNVAHFPMPMGQQGRERAWIKVDSLINYVKSKTKRFRKAIQYFTCEDTYYFWYSHEKNFEETFLQKERKRYKKHAKV